MVTAENATPLFISPVIKCQREETDIGRYEVLQKSVTEAPYHEDGEIETALEIYYGPDDTPLWKRVVVRSGPICQETVTHASFQLEGLEGEVDVTSPLGNVLCWAAFPEQPDHAFLCVLASRTLLCIWDVYPDPDQASSVGEGQSIALPFEAASIHALEGGHSGLLIQRMEAIDDHLDAQNMTWNKDNYGTTLEVDDDDSEFILKPPPRPVRTSIDTLNASTATSAIPSLFSLSHHLDDVLPVSDLTDRTTPGSQPAIFSDVFEKVIFVGTVSGVDPNSNYLDKREFRYPVCVTYHTHKKR